MALELLEDFQGMILTKEKEDGIVISADKRESAAEDCALSLFGRFLTMRSFNQQAVREVLQRAWRMGSDLRIVEVGFEIYQFKFLTAGQRDWVYDNGPWTFENDILLLHQWTKGLHLATIRFTHIQVWVQLWGIPFDLMSKTVGMAIGNKMGSCIKIGERPWSSEQARFMRV